MIYPCKDNRVARTYLGGHRIDALRSVRAADGYMPEEWVASVTRARNAGSTNPDEGLSVTRDGELLAEILKATPEMLGGYKELPILLKLLDASERLVIQVHPTVDFAMKYLNSQFGKTECWYIISADNDAHVYLGFKEGATREEWMAAFECQDIEKMLSMLHKIKVSVGDLWYVDGGVPHAIGGNCLMAELQEPTDLMVVPERYTPSGRKLAEERLHCGLGFEKMFDMFDYTTYSEERLRKKFYRRTDINENCANVLVGQDLSDKFCMFQYSVNGKCNIQTNELPSVAVVIEGEGILTDLDCSVEVKAGDSVFIPATAIDITVCGKIKLIVATPPMYK